MPSCAPPADVSEEDRAAPGARFACRWVALDHDVDEHRAAAGELHHHGRKFAIERQSYARSRLGARGEICEIGFAGIIRSLRQIGVCRMGMSAAETLDIPEARRRCRVGGPLPFRVHDVLLPSRRLGAVGKAGTAPRTTRSAGGRRSSDSVSSSQFAPVGAAWLAIELGLTRLPGAKGGPQPVPRRASARTAASEAKRSGRAAETLCRSMTGHFPKLAAKSLNLHNCRASLGSANDFNSLS
jgi:hypothetical protein